MSREGARVVPAVHGLRRSTSDPAFEEGFAAHLRATHKREELLDLYGRFATGRSDFDALQRRVIWRAVARRLGEGVRIGAGVGFKHLETFDIGDAVFIGDHAYIQGRFDGRTKIGDHCWIGPQAYFDARDLELGDYVGWGPGAKVVGSTHTGVPLERPIIQTDLVIRPVRVEDRADVGANAVVLPGVTIGEGSIVGAGAVVNRDVPPYAIVAGVPARFLRWREGYEPPVGAGSKTP